MYYKTCLEGSGSLTGGWISQGFQKVQEKWCGDDHGFLEGLGIFDYIWEKNTMVVLLQSVSPANS